MTSSTFYPTSSEYVLTGLFGLFLYGILLFCGCWAAYAGTRSKPARAFFYSIIGMCLLEVPRYLELAIEGEYDSRVCYAFHILAGILFFAAFSVVAYQWSGLLSLASYFRVVYGWHALVVANVTFGLVDVASVGMCLSSSSLAAYFFSTAYTVIMLVEALRNVVYRYDRILSTNI